MAPEFRKLLVAERRKPSGRLWNSAASERAACSIPLESWCHGQPPMVISCRRLRVSCLPGRKMLAFCFQLMWSRKVEWP